MPDRLACREVVMRMARFHKAAEDEGLEPRKAKGERKLDYTSATLHESQRKRFREAVKSLGLYRHPDRPVIDTRKRSENEPNARRYVWKEGWPK